MASAKKPRKGKGRGAGGATGGQGGKRAAPKKSLPKKPATRLSRDL